MITLPRAIRKQRASRRWPLLALAWLAALLAWPCGVYAAEAPLGLAELEELALGHNRQIAEALANQAAAQARVTQQEAEFLPQVSGQATWEEGRSQLGSTSSSTGGAQRLAGLYLNQSLFKWSQWGARQASQWEARAYEAQVQATANQVLAEVRAAYFALLTAGKVLAVYEEQEKDAAAALTRAEKMLQHGLAAPLERARAQLDLAEAQGKVIEGRAELRRTQARLALGVGLPHVYDAALADWQAPPAPALELALASGEADLARRVEQGRPEVRKLDYQAKAAEASLDSAQGGHYPNLDLEAGLGRGGKHDLDGEFHSYGLVLSLPIFSGWRVSGGVREKTALLQAARQARQQKAQEARKEVLQAVQGALEARAKLEVSKSQVAAAAENYRLIKGRHINGLATPLELSEARTQHFEALAGAEKARFNAFGALAELDRATGGGVFPAQGEPRP